MRTCPKCFAPIHEGVAFCPNCGLPVANMNFNGNAGNAPGGTVTGSYTQSYSQSNMPYYQGSQHDQSYGKYYEKHSPLAIIAFIFSFLGFLSMIGLVMAIIDLSKTDGRKKWMSITAIVIAGLWILLFIVAGVSSDNKSTESDYSSEYSFEEYDDETVLYVRLNNAVNDRIAGFADRVIDMLPGSKVICP